MLDVGPTGLSHPLPVVALAVVEESPGAERVRLQEHIVSGHIVATYSVTISSITAQAEWSICGI